MVSFEFYIDNYSFGDYKIIDIIYDNPYLFKVMLSYYNQEKKIWEQWIYSGDQLTDEGSLYIQVSETGANDNRINITCSFPEFIDTDYISSNPLFMTYTLIYFNEYIPLEPYPHNYYYYYYRGKGQLKLITNELMGSMDILAQGNAILNKWLLKDSLNIVNDLKDSHSHIIVNKDRKILLPNENTNILITRDNNSEEITFEVPRFYDGIDLTTKNLSIYYIRPVTSGEEKPAGVRENLDLQNYSDETLYASWTVTDKVTNTPGILTFAIIAEGNGYTDTYFWQTYPAQLRVDSGIYGDLPPTEESFAIVEFDEFQKELYNTIQSLKAFHEKGELKWQSITDLIEILDKQDTKSESED